MGVQFTIKNVPKEVRDELAARAAREGKSMQEFLRAAIESIASRPSPKQWIAMVSARKELSGTHVSADEIVQTRSQDRR
jgi:plasmid stability protein